jgi:hypothetical protein
MANNLITKNTSRKSPQISTETTPTSSGWAGSAVSNETSQGSAGRIGCRVGDRATGRVDRSEAGEVLGARTDDSRV